MADSQMVLLHPTNHNTNQYIRRMKNLSILSLAALLAASAHGADIPPGMAEVVLEVGDLTGYGNVGFQWILDSSHSTYNNRFFEESLMYFGDYSAFDYFVPEDAEAKYPTDNMAVNSTVRAYVPAGIYDWMVIQPDMDGLMYALGDDGRVDDFTLLEGETYRLTFSEENGPDGWGYYTRLHVATDIAVTSVSLPVASIDLTDAEDITVRLTNNGSDDMSGFSISYSVNGASPVTETFHGTLKGGESADYCFNTKADFSGKGSYEVNVSVYDDRDMIASNNSMLAKTRNLSPVNPPYTMDFSKINEEQLPEEWFIINNSPDAGWNYSSWKINKNGDMGVAYCMSGFSQDGDDWMISQPINLKEGKAHVLFSVCSANEERTEYLEIYTGTSLNPAEMSLIAEYAITSSEWSDKAVNFDIREDGVHYIAFRGISPSTAYSFNIGDVTIDEGEFAGSPMIKMERVLAPYSNCDVSSQSRLGMRVTNKGTGAMTGHTLTAYVDDVKFVTEFSDPVAPDETADLYMDRMFDLSKTGSYDIQLILSYDDTDISQEFTVECFKPLEDMPVVTNFSHNLNTGIWQSMTSGAWSYEPMFETFSSEKSGKMNGLLSRGIKFSNPARFKISYMAPGWDSGAMAIYMGPASDDPSSYTEVFRDTEISNEAKEVEFTAAVPSAGNYSFIIADEAPSVSRNRLRLNQVEISQVYPYDICLNAADGSLAPYTPANAVKGQHKYELSIVNRGSEKMTGIKGCAILDGVKVCDSSSALTLLPGESGVLPIYISLPEKNAGDSFEPSFDITADQQDLFPADNTLSLATFHVTEYTFAHENISDLTYGTGNNGEPLAIGYIYTLPEMADATGMTVGLAVVEEENLPNVLADIAFSVYKMNADGTIDRRLWSETRTRGMGGLIDVDFPDMRLDAGAYYFEVAQLSNYNMGIAQDIEGETICYSRKADNTLEAVPTYPVCIRANFAPDAEIYRRDAAATCFTTPSYAEGLYSDSTTVKAIVRNAGYSQADFKVELTLDGIKVGEKSVSLCEYDEQEVVFEDVNLSNPGDHTLTATAILADDENADNNSVSIAVKAHAEADPYMMDFENCFDFDAAGDPWNPRWKTVDFNGVATDLFWRYQYPHQGEPVGFIAFNIKQTIPSMEEMPLEGFYPHSGERFGVAFNFNSWSEGAENLETSDIWIISPKLQLGEDSEFELYVKTRMLESNFSRLEPYRILISETDDAPESFSVLGDNERLAAVEDWEKVTVDLSAYDRKAVHVALQYIGRSSVNTCLMIDDLHVKTDLLNNVDSIEAESPVTVNGRDISAPSGSRVYTTNGLETGLTSLSPGIYIVKTPTRSVKVAIR